MMSRFAQRMRAADPAARLDLPEFDARADDELVRLVGGSTSASPATWSPFIPAGSRPRRRALVITAAVGVIVIAGIAAALVASDRATPSPAASAGPTLTAERVVFAGSPEVAKGAERFIERALEQRTSRPRTSDFARNLGQATDRSPQLRFDAPTEQYAFSAGYGARGRHRFDFLGFGYGQDSVQVILMRCLGDASYRWDVTGQVGSSHRTRLVAAAIGTCGDGITAARYVLPYSVSEPKLTVRISKSVDYSVAAIEASFGAPILDSPYPKG